MTKLIRLALVVAVSQLLAVTLVAQEKPAATEAPKLAAAPAITAEDLVTSMRQTRGALLTRAQEAQKRRDESPEGKAFQAALDELRAAEVALSAQLKVKTGKVIDWNTGLLSAPPQVATK